MLYMLIVLNSLNDPIVMKVYKDLDTCLEKKKISIEYKNDAHCVRLQEPGTIIQDLRP